jgi:2,4-diketo-3-deoxy-L-fuconate hydrolase
MRLCRYDNDRLGVVIGNNVHDVTAAQDEIRRAAPYDMMGDAVIAALPAWRSRIEDMAKAAPGKPLAEVKLLPPVARPSKVMAAPTNYRAHVEEMAARQGRPADQHRGIGAAGIFLKANSSIVGPSDTIPLRFSDRLNEHELEVVVIIGKKGTNIPKERAFDYILGYSIGMDITMRGDETPSYNKSFDTFGVLGPWVVTREEIAQPNNLDIRLWLNGELRQDETTSRMVLDVPSMFEFASSVMTLYPGDIFMTGNPKGASRIAPGDMMLAEIESIGRMEVAVRAEKKS